MALGGQTRPGGRSLASFKSLFFDRRAVESAAERGTLRALARFGAIVRRKAQTSMRYRKGASLPGQPPSAHKSKRLAALKKLGRTSNNGALLRELLFFAYDPRSKSVVVGPVGFNRSPVPNLHEFGGSEAGRGRLMAVDRKKRKAKGDPVAGRLVRLKGTVRYPRRPFMNPALNQSMSQFAESFRGTVTGG